MVATGSDDGALVLWDVTAGPVRVVANVSVVQKRIHSVKFSPDGRRIASAGMDRRAYLFDVSPLGPGSPANQSAAGVSLTLRHTLPEQQDAGVAVAWRTAKDFAVASISPPVHLLSIVSAGTSEEHVVTTAKLDIPTPEVTSLEFAHNERELLAAGTSSNLVRAWQVAHDFKHRGPEFTRMNCTQELLDASGTSEATVTAADWTSDGRTFIAGTSKSFICVWREEEEDWNVTGVLHFDFNHTHVSPVSVAVVEFSPSGTLIAGGDSSGTVQVWQVSETGDWETVGSWSRTDSAGPAVTDVGWSPDEQRVAAAYEDGALMLWDMFSVDPMKPVFQAPLDAPIFAVDYRLEQLSGCDILAAGDMSGKLYVWRACNGQAPELIHSFTSKTRGVLGIKWSSRGMLASVGVAGMVDVHMVTEAAVSLVHSFSGHVGPVYGLGWDPTGDNLVTAGDDAGVRLWMLGVDQTGNGKGFTTVRLNKICRAVEIVSYAGTDRLACSRDIKSLSDTTPVIFANPLYTAAVEYQVLQPSQMMHILREMTYGFLSDNDMRALGYWDIQETAMDLSLIPQSTTDVFVGITDDDGTGDFAAARFPCPDS